MKRLFINNVLKNHKINTLQRKFIAQGAFYRQNNSDVKLKGKFLKSLRPDMPTLVFIPEIFESSEGYERFFSDPDNGILQYRNVWILSQRNFGDSDHHPSFDLDDMADDVKRFIDEKQLSIVTIGGHGHGAKVACAFSTKNLERTSGVMCIEGGPIDHNYHPWWLECREAILAAYRISKKASSVSEFSRQFDSVVSHKKWNKLIKNNLIESSTGLSFKFNIDDLEKNVRKVYSDIVTFTPRFGLFPGRAFVNFASESSHIYLSTNTIPIYSFFPKLEGQFASASLNYIQCNDDYMSKEIIIVILYILIRSLVT